MRPTKLQTRSTNTIKKVELTLSPFAGSIPLIQESFFACAWIACERTGTRKEQRQPNPQRYIVSRPSPQSAAWPVADLPDSAAADSMRFWKHIDIAFGKIGVVVHA